MQNLLYYPGFQIKDENWLKYALIYIDTINPIIPNSARADLDYQFKKIMAETDLLSPINPEIDDGYNASIKSIEEIEKILRSPNRYKPYFNKFKMFDSVDDQWRNDSVKTYTLYTEKYSLDFEMFCVENKLAKRCSEGIILAEDLAFIYMSKLADTISNRTKYETITDNNKYRKYLDYCRINTNIDTIEYKQFKKMMLMAVPSQLQDIPLDRFIELRSNTNFDASRKAFVSSFKKYATDDRKAYDSMYYEDYLSARKEIMDLAKSYFKVSLFTVSLFVTAIELITPPITPIVVASAAALIETAGKIPQDIQLIKNSTKELATKRLANNYYTAIKNVYK